MRYRQPSVPDERPDTGLLADAESACASQPGRYAYATVGSRC